MADNCNYYNTPETHMISFINDRSCNVEDDLNHAPFQCEDEMDTMNNSKEIGAIDTIQPSSSQPAVTRRSSQKSLHTASLTSIPQELQPCLHVASITSIPHDDFEQCVSSQPLSLEALTSSTKEKDQCKTANVLPSKWFNTGTGYWIPILSIVLVLLVTLLAIFVVKPPTDPSGNVIIVKH